MEKNASISNIPPAEELEHSAGVLPDVLTGEANAALAEKMRTCAEGALSGANSPEETRELAPEDREILLATLKDRFATYPIRHMGVQWGRVETALRTHKQALWTIQKLEENGGEPDVFMADDGGFVMGDCCTESPAMRSNVVFDREAEVWLKKNNYPKKTVNGNAADLVAAWGAQFMTDEQYLHLQKSGEYNLETWCWVICSNPEKQVAELGEPRYALYGFRSQGEVHVEPLIAHFHAKGGAPRCVIRVEYV